MTRTHRIGVLLVVGLALAGCAKAPPLAEPSPAFDSAQVDGQKAYEEVERLVALGLRDSGTEGARKAAEHIKARLEALGVSADIDAFRDSSPKGEIVFRNVIGRIPGTGTGLIVIGSHYDTKVGMKEGFEGANDSGSSTGLLLELGRVLAQGPRVEPEIVLAFFDGEECMVRYGPRDGLHGSRRLAKQIAEEGKAQQVVAVIILDMIGDKDLTVTFPRNSTPRLVSLGYEAAHEENVRSKFTMYPVAIGDDHVPFMLEGMPAVDFIDFYYGSAPKRNDYWHRPTDTMDKISAESLGIVGRVTVRMINKLLLGEEKP